MKISVNFGLTLRLSSFFRHDFELNLFLNIIQYLQLFSNKFRNVQACSSLHIRNNHRITDLQTTISTSAYLRRRSRVPLYIVWNKCSFIECILRMENEWSPLNKHPLLFIANVKRYWHLIWWGKYVLWWLTVWSTRTPCEARSISKFSRPLYFFLFTPGWMLL